MLAYLALRRTPDLWNHQGSNPKDQLYRTPASMASESNNELWPQVEAPLDKVYKIWSNRLNYNEWFDLIGQVCFFLPSKVIPA